MEQYGSLIDTLENRADVIEAMTLITEIKLTLTFTSDDGDEFTPNIRVKLWQGSSNEDGHTFHAVPNKHFNHPERGPYRPGNLTGTTLAGALKAVISSLRGSFLSIKHDEFEWEDDLLVPNDTY